MESLVVFIFYFISGETFCCAHGAIRCQVKCYYLTSFNFQVFKAEINTHVCYLCLHVYHFVAVTVPENPCTEPDKPLYCLTCVEAPSTADCQMAGSYEKCEPDVSELL